MCLFYVSVATHTNTQKLTLVLAGPPGLTLQGSLGGSRGLVVRGLLLVAESAPQSTQQLAQLAKGGFGVLLLDLGSLLRAEEDVGGRGALDLVTLLLLGGGLDRNEKNESSGKVGEIRTQGTLMTLLSLNSSAGRHALGHIRVGKGRWDSTHILDIGRYVVGIVATLTYLLGGGGLGLCSCPFGVGKLGMDGRLCENEVMRRGSHSIFIFSRNIMDIGHMKW